MWLGTARGVRRENENPTLDVGKYHLCSPDCYIVIVATAIVTPAALKDSGALSKEPEPEASLQLTVPVNIILVFTAFDHRYVTKWC